MLNHYGYRKESLSPRRKEPAVPRSTNQLQYISKTLLPAVRKYEVAWPFLQPVDPVAMGLTDYLQVISQPMDLSTIASRLKERFYTDAQQCLLDFERMFANCYLYNRDEEVRFAPMLLPLSSSTASVYT